MIMMILIIMLSALLVIAALCAAFGIHLEKKSFNNGICINCKYHLKLFDYDSHNGRGYQCPKCKYIVWVSYNCVDKNYRGEKDDY